MNKPTLDKLAMGGALLEYAIVNVFVDDPARPFEGNPLAVVFGADALTTAQCQTITDEFNLSETVFPMSPTVDGADYRARIFTIGSELPFAGHPSVGVAWTLAQLGILRPGRAVQECPVGLVTLEIPAARSTDSADSPDSPRDPDPADPTGDTGDTDATGLVRLTGPVPAVSDPVDPQPLLAAVGLSHADLAGPPPRLCGTGLRFAHLNVHPEALSRLRPNPGALATFDPSAIGVQVFAFPDGPTAPAGEPLAVRARVMTADIAEDSATGSAAIALAGWLMASDLAAVDGETRYTIRQGVEMGRPSVLACDVTAREGVIERVRVAGRVAPVATGSIRVP